MNEVDSLVEDALRILALVGVVAALFVTVGVLLTIVRSIWRVVFGSATLVMPFGGNADAGLNEVLAQQLDDVERRWRALSIRLKEAHRSGLAPDPLVDPGPLNHVLPDNTLTDEQDQFIVGHPLDGAAIAPFSFGGISVTPEALFQLFYRIRDAVARRTIQASVHQFGDTVRLSATFTHVPASVERDGTKSVTRAARRDRRRDPVVIVRKVDEPRRLLDLIDDASFRVAKLRLGFRSDAETWSGYLALIEGYVAHLDFLRDGHTTDRERAIGRYEQALVAEPAYALAHYNLGVLLYNRYLEDANAQALEHFRAAAESDNLLLRALALSGVALAAAQNVNRFHLSDSSWISTADAASAEAVRIGPDLEEAHFSRGFAHQIAGRTTKAIESYDHAVDLPVDRPGDRQIKSFALNNRGWLQMTVLTDLDAADHSFREALTYFEWNKMSHANLGEIAKRRGRFDEALAQYEQAIELDLGYVNGMNELAMVHLAMAAAAEAHGDDHGRAASLAAAEGWHARALRLIPEASVHQREDVSRTFAAARSEYGLPDP